jgi:iron complex transport system substrate-binding protein
MRVCSLLPSATEIVGHLGLVDSLVGVSEECDWPTGVRELPVVTASRVDPRSLTSGEIDAAVREAVSGGRSLYALDEAQLEQLAPDVILTQDLCTVCAVSGDDVARLCPVKADVISLNPMTLEGIAASVETLARRLGVEDRGRAVAREMREAIAEVQRAVAGRPARRVFVAEWLDPPFAAGHWVPEMAAAAGGQDVLGRPGEPSYAVSWDEVSALEPELIVIAACGFDANRAAAEAEGVELPVPAVAVDANAYFSRPAPRVAEGVRQLGFLFHPEVCADPGLPAVYGTSRFSAETRPRTAKSPA